MADSNSNIPKFEFYLNRQGLRGRSGEKGDAGFAPIIEIGQNTLNTFTLLITTETGTFETPNLRGSIINNAGQGTFLRYDAEEDKIYLSDLPEASFDTLGGVTRATEEDVKDGSGDGVITASDLGEGIFGRLVQGENVKLEYNEDTDTITISSEGGSSGECDFNEYEIIAPLYKKEGTDYEKDAVIVNGTVTDAELVFLDDWHPTFSDQSSGSFSTAGAYTVHGNNFTPNSFLSIPLRSGDIIGVPADTGADFLIGQVDGDPLNLSPEFMCRIDGLTGTSGSRSIIRITDKQASGSVVNCTGELPSETSLNSFTIEQGQAYLQFIIEQSELKVVFIRNSASRGVCGVVAKFTGSAAIEAINRCNRVYFAGTDQLHNPLKNIKLFKDTGFDLANITSDADLADFSNYINLAFPEDGKTMGVGYDSVFIGLDRNNNLTVTDDVVTTDNLSRKIIAGENVSITQVNGAIEISSTASGGGGGSGASFPTPVAPLRKDSSVESLITNMSKNDNYYYGTQLNNVTWNTYSYYLETYRVPDGISTSTNIEGFTPTRFIKFPYQLGQTLVFKNGSTNLKDGLCLMMCKDNGDNTYTPRYVYLRDGNGGTLIFRPSRLTTSSTNKIQIYRAYSAVQSTTSVASDTTRNIPNVFAIAKDGTFLLNYNSNTPNPSEVVSGNFSQGYFEDINCILVIPKTSATTDTAPTSPASFRYTDSEDGTKYGVKGTNLDTVTSSLISTDVDELLDAKPLYDFSEQVITETLRLDYDKETLGVNSSGELTVIGGGGSGEGGVSDYEDLTNIPTLDGLDIKGAIKSDKTTDVEVTFDGEMIGGNVKISADADNLLEKRDDGLYVKQEGSSINYNKPLETRRTISSPLVNMERQGNYGYTTMSPFNSWVSGSVTLNAGTQENVTKRMPYSYIEIPFKWGQTLYMGSISTRMGVALFAKKVSDGDFDVRFGVYLKSTNTNSTDAIQNKAGALRYKSAEGNLLTFSTATSSTTTTINTPSDIELCSCILTGVNGSLEATIRPLYRADNQAYLIKFPVSTAVSTTEMLECDTILVIPMNTSAASYSTGLVVEPTSANRVRLLDTNINDTSEFSESGIIPNKAWVDSTPIAFDAGTQIITESVNLSYDEKSFSVNSEGQLTLDVTIKSITKTDYDSLDPKDPNTLYIITD